MNYHDLIPRLAGACIHDHQIRNLDLLLEASAQFSRAAGIECPSHPPVVRETAVIESGHQPNFLPYPGIFKKAFLLDSIIRTAADHGIHAIGVFGFADQNLSTAPILSANRVPSMTRDGFEKIGFKIGEDQHWNQFCTIGKPPRDVWERKMGQVTDFYEKAFRDIRSKDRSMHERIGQLIEICSSCYARAENFADLNAFIFAAFCQHYLGIQTLFYFRYSDVYKNNIFVYEGKKLAANRETYIEAHNRALAMHAVDDPRPLGLNHIPFWYHCTCGRKLELLSTDSTLWTGHCDGCKREYAIEMDPGLPRFDALYKNLGCTAISRNLVFSEGLGVRIFISGTGGSLRYGMVSDFIGKEIKFCTPLAICWGGGDYYLGLQHQKAMDSLKNIFSLEDEDFTGSDLNSRVSLSLAEIDRELNTWRGDLGNEAELKKLSGRRKNAITQAGISKKLFSVTPSMLDLLVSVDPREILSKWQEAVRRGSFTGDGRAMKLLENCAYQGSHGFIPRSIPPIFQAMNRLEVNP
jgi:hypothetical protein